MLHPDYDKRFADQTTDSLHELAQLDLSCATQYSNPKVLYAQILEAYSRNAILYTDARRDTESDDAKQGRLDEAMTVAQKGLEIVRSAEADQNNSGKPFAERIAPDAAIATEEALTTDSKRLKELMEE